MNLLSNRHRIVSLDQLVQQPFPHLAFAGNLLQAVDFLLCHFEGD